MYGKFQDFLKAEIQSIKDAGLYKTERLIATPQDAEIKLTTGETVLNFCANNYLGLSSHPRVIEGAKKALDARGYGMSSVRFICGTQDIHKELEAKISKFFGTEDTILYAACLFYSFAFFWIKFMNSTYSFYLKNRINRKFQLVLRIAHRLLTNSICISIFQNAIVLQNTTLSILLTYISFFKT